MLHKTYLAMLFAMAAALAGLGLTSLWRYVGWRGFWADERWAVLELQDGNMRIGHAYLTDRAYSHSQTRVPLGWFGVVGYVSGRNYRGWRYQIMTLPLWTVVGLLFIHPAVAFVRGPVRRRRRRRCNQCIECGYYLAGNLSGRCPECGTLITKLRQNT